MRGGPPPPHQPPPHQSLPSCQPVLPPLADAVEGAEQRLAGQTGGGVAVAQLHQQPEMIGGRAQQAIVPKVGAGEKQSYGPASVQAAISMQQRNNRIAPVAKPQGLDPMTLLQERE